MPIFDKILCLGQGSVARCKRYAFHLFRADMRHDAPADAPADLRHLTVSLTVGQVQTQQAGQNVLMRMLLIFNRC